MKRMWTFNTRHFQVAWDIEDDELCTRYMEKDLAAQCKRLVARGTWKCFSSRISVTHCGTGVVLSEVYLGGSIYGRPAEFRDHFGMKAKGHGSYFSDMVREAVAEARENFARMQSSVAKTRFHATKPVAEVACG